MYKTAIVLFICSLISKCLGFARQIVVAYKFGSGSVSDAFVTTNSIPTVMFSALSVAIGINFIPVIQSIENGDRKKKDRFASNIISVSLIIMTIGIILMLLVPDLILVVFATGLSEKAHEIAIKMLYITAFSIIPIVLAQIYQSYLQTSNHFISTGLTGIVCNVVVIVFTILSNEQMFWMLSVGTLLSHMVMLVILVAEAKKIGFVYNFFIDLECPYLRKLVILTIPLMLETFLNEFNVVLDRNLASRLEGGTITNMSYASSLVNMATVIVASSITTVVFPAFSRFYSEKKSEEIKKQFLYYGEMLSSILIPMSVVLMLFAKPVVEILFDYGAFSEQAVSITSESLRFYAIGVFFIGMIYYINRLYYAMQDTKTPTICVICSLMVNIVLNLVLIEPYQHKGLAFATSVAYGVSFLLLLLRLCKKIGRHSIIKLLNIIIKYFIMAGTTGYVIWNIYKAFNVYWNQYVLILVCALFFGVTYLLLLAIFGGLPYRAIIKKFIKRIRGIYGYTE